MRHYPWRALFKGVWRSLVALVVTTAFVIVTGILAGGPSFTWLAVGLALSLFAAVPGYLLYRLGAPEHAAGNRVVMLLVLSFASVLGALLVLPVYMSREGVPTDARVTQVVRAVSKVSEHRFPAYQVAERDTGENLGRLRFMSTEPKVGETIRVRKDPRGWFNVTVADPTGRFTKLAALVVAVLGIAAFFLGAGGHMPD
ncbi:hypothetical protein [Dactylosporangium matsuzakiense]|uniref:DUF3592 domain-containing protein n=1 Tax=Dactylosporangium matsuzakiense TaxID=53360 RepID=A0A9W6KVB6_9ACTN|nr:hypothetical protein [Dactylosporangium matsuzakiense]UWZ49062.1 hypothetical protein Dmats_23310 [Dactylosporangium matsuzakiense]GLL08746.1 hypothetical protein GCM10017581_105170 [Dactylosporangium matsuzakiense]